jgi:hypothetical protein
MIGHTGMSDDQIKQLCEDVDQRWVYNLWSNNCQDFAFCIAAALIKPEDRSPVWNILFGEIERQERVLRLSRTLQYQLADAYALMNHLQDSTTYGGVADVRIPGSDAHGGLALSIPAATYTPHLHDGHETAFSGGHIHHF